ncbi:Quinone oxidoreductase 2 [Metarhizium brunneum]|uniref:Quinone oxidoreductase 2 n=1 Tax=Metarhizium brunneum TaxID=500148 RepID=A0A7D5Z8N7_9HYPO
MPKYVLTRAGGNLGGAAASYALDIAKPDDEIVLTTSDVDGISAVTLKDWIRKGARVCFASYDDAESLRSVFVGAEAVTLISTWLLGEGRRCQARTVIDAAKQCGVKRICYTSFVGAGMQAEREEDVPFLPRDHRVIEAYIYESGLEYNIQRNYLYIDNIPVLFGPSWKICNDRWLSNSHGKAGAYVAREDCGRVLASLLLGRGQPNTVYDVTGPEAITDERIFEWVCSQSGYQGQFVSMTDEGLKKFWLDRGLPSVNSGNSSNLPMKLCIEDLLCCGEMVAKGYMRNTSNAVEELTGQPAIAFQVALLKYRGIFPQP